MNSNRVPVTFRPGPYAANPRRALLPLTIALALAACATWQAPAPDQTAQLRTACIAAGAPDLHTCADLLRLEAFRDGAAQ